MADVSDRRRIPKAILISLSEANDPQRNAVQTIVAAHSKTWWHELSDVWIVGDEHGVGYWVDLIVPVLSLSRAQVFVVGLPKNTEGRPWAGTGSEDSFGWLRDQYSSAENSPLTLRQNQASLDSEGRVMEARGIENGPARLSEE